MMRKKFTAIALSVVLSISLIPAALAAEGEDSTYSNGVVNVDVAGLIPGTNYSMIAIVDKDGNLIALGSGTTDASGNLTTAITTGAIADSEYDVYIYNNDGTVAKTDSFAVGGSGSNVDPNPNPTPEPTPEPNPAPTPEPAPNPNPIPKPTPTPGHNNNNNNNINNTNTASTNKEITETTDDGVSGTSIMDKSGNIVSAKAEIPANVAKNAAQSGIPVTLPLEVVSATTLSAFAPMITVTTNCSQEVPVEIPVISPTPSTVVVFVNADGNETVIPTCTISKNSVIADLPDGATVKIVNRVMYFSDVGSNDWFNNAVEFVSARGILTGTGENLFGESTSTSRAMVWTMLARLAGVDTSTGANWYANAQQWAIANGVSDGTDPNGEITREQLVTMLWRYIGEPDASASLNGFTDFGKVSSWSEVASRWAVENSVMNGMDGALNPQGMTTRAQLAQFIMNFINTI